MVEGSQECIDREFIDFKGETRKSFPRKVLGFSLLVYLFLVFFGTSMPFKDSPEQVDDILTTNPIHQLVFPPLYAVSLIALWFKRKQVARLIKAEKWLTIFLAWSLLSILWSDFAFISFKRWLQVFGATALVLASLLYARSADDIIQYIKWILIVYIPVTFLSVMIVPEAKQMGTSAWRGISDHKNTLGQVAVISLMIWFHEAQKDRLQKARFISISLLLCSFVLLLGSQSVTSIVAFLAFVAIYWICFLEKEFRPLTGRLFFVVFALAFIASLSVVCYSFPDILYSMLNSFGKDSTFTGRVELWKSVFEEIRPHLILGYGFGGFWVVDSPVTNRIFEDFVFLPNTSHQGYLDILSETGLIGIAIFTFMTLSFLRKSAKEKSFFWKFPLIIVLVLNIQESTIFKPNSITGTIFILCYLALYAQREYARELKFQNTSNSAPFHN